MRAVAPPQRLGYQMMANGCFMRHLSRYGAMRWSACPRVAPDLYCEGSHASGWWWTDSGWQLTEGGG